MQIKDYVRIGLDAFPSPVGRIFVYPRDAQTLSSWLMTMARVVLIYPTAFVSLPALFWD